MILDVYADPDTARRYDVLCARTGDTLLGWDIVYANDVEGVVRHFVRDESGNFLPNAAGDGIAVEEVRKAIKIVPLSPEVIAGVEEFERWCQLMRQEPRP